MLRWRAAGVSRAQATGNQTDDPIKLVTIARTDTATNRAAAQPVAETVADLPFRVPAAGSAPWQQTAGALKEPRRLPRMNTRGDRLIQLVSQHQELQDDPIPGADASPADAIPPAPPATEQQPPSVPPPTHEPLPAPSAARDIKNIDDEAQSKSCDRNYNERNCCEDEGRCGDARKQWQRDALSKISLDITPQLRPDELDPYKEEALRNADLAQSPVRGWHNRKGEVIVTGRLNNIQRGRLLVLDADNQIVKIPFGELGDDDLCFATAWWRVPNECTFGNEVYLARDWQPSTLTWKATGVCHKPLYFEEPQLERYGHTTGHFVQPFLSGAHFFLNLVALPYNAGINPPWECQYPLGYYRPGSCAPWLVPPVPLSVRGALWEAGVFVGGVAIIP